MSKSSFITKRTYSKIDPSIYFGGSSSSGGGGGNGPNYHFFLFSLITGFIIYRNQ